MTLDLRWAKSVSVVESKLFSFPICFWVRSQLDPRKGRYFLVTAVAGVLGAVDRRFHSGAYALSNRANCYFFKKEAQPNLDIHFTNAEGKNTYRSVVGYATQADGSPGATGTLRFKRVGSSTLSRIPDLVARYFTKRRGDAVVESRQDAQRTPPSMQKLVQPRMARPIVGNSTLVVSGAPPCPSLREVGSLSKCQSRRMSLRARFHTSIHPPGSNDCCFRSRRDGETVSTEDEQVGEDDREDDEDDESEEPTVEAYSLPRTHAAFFVMIKQLKTPVMV